jgi:hypothetical protein
MTRQWYEPSNFSEWFKRAFSFLNIAVFMITAIFFISELRFDWFENLVGSYLVSTNEYRPKTGVIWETGKHTTDAHEYLNKIINRKEDTQQNVYKASSFSNLVSDILPGDWVTLEKKHFKSLYMSLEKSMAVKIVDPVQLIWLFKSSMLDRIFCEGIPGGIKIYFIDSENRVIKQIELKNQDIIDIESGEQAVPGELSNMEGFLGRIYPAEKFFDAVFKLPSDILPDLMVNPEILLAQKGEIIKIGIWNVTQNGYIKLGFEFETEAERKIVFLKGREWAVWQLSLYLQGDGS